MGFNESVAFLEKTLQGLMLRQKTISHNIANQSTPGYRAKTVEFHEALSGAMRRDDVANLEFSVVEGGGGNAKLDGNNVDLEREWMNMEETRLLHEMFARALGGRFRSTMRAISGQ